MKFTTQTDNAKFNTFEIKDASGATLVKTKAADLADPLTVANNKVPKNFRAGNLEGFFATD
ncbi:MAG: hypothetical protein WDM76_04455 [Limisphaerales bacterium]